MGSARDIASDPDRTYRRAHLAHSAYPTSSYSRSVFLSAQNIVGNFTYGMGSFIWIDE
jgi:hypothetical protein